MATNWGGLTGSVIGTGIGAFGGPLTAGIGGMIGGGIGGMFDPQGGGTPGQAGGYQWLQNPEYAQATNAMGNYWDYLSGGLQSMQEGKPPTWFQNWRPLEESQRKQALYGTYYGKGAGARGGNQFGPGVLATQSAKDVAAGRRGAGAGSNYAKQLDEYAQAMNDIDEYFSKLGFGAMDTSEQRYLTSFQNSANIRGPQGQWGSFEGVPFQPSGMQSMMQGVGAMLPYMAQGWGANPGNQGSSYNYGTNYATNPYGTNYSNINYNQPSNAYQDFYGQLKY